VRREELELRTARVRLFAYSRELIGSEEIRVQMKDRMTVGDLKAIICEQYPALSKVKFAVAVNHKVEDDAALLNYNDEIAILPPVSGGCR
jgi:molybdopterin converting factor subunit 1